MKSGFGRSTLTALAVILVLTACQPVSPTPPTGTRQPDPVSTATRTPRRVTPTPSATARPSLGIGPAALNGTQVTVWHAFFGASAEVFEAQAVQFSASNEWGIQIVTRSTRGSYPLLFEEVSAAVEEGDPPSLVIGLPEYLSAWDAVDLTPYLHDADWGLGAEELADIPEIFMAQEQVDGRQMGMPALRSARLLLYNLTWARELGFTAPPVTSEEFRVQACAGNAAFRRDEDQQNDGYGGWLVDTDPSTALGWLFAFDGAADDGATDDSSGYQFNTAANRAALTFVKELYDDNCAWLSTNPEPFAPFAGRRALFATASLSEFEAVKRAFDAAGNDDDWSVLAFPGPDSRSLPLSGASFMVMPSTDEAQLAAWLFVRWLLSPDSQSRWARNTGLLPLRTSTLGDLEAYKIENPQWAAATELIETGHVQPVRLSWREVRLMVGDSFDHLFRFDLPLDDIPDLLAEMDETAEELDQ
ncbi:MAG: extracellular solute-binding protein [Chloroflexota bacterium]